MQITVYAKSVRCLIDIPPLIQNLQAELKFAKKFKVDKRMRK